MNENVDKVLEVIKYGNDVVFLLYLLVNARSKCYIKPI